MRNYSWLALGITFLILAFTVLTVIGLIDLVTPGVDGDSTTTSSPSGLEKINNDLTMLRGCADAELIQWTESTDLWGCAGNIDIPGTLDVTGATTLDSTLDVAGLTTLAVPGNPVIARNTTDGVSNQVGILSGANATRADDDQIYQSWKMAVSDGTQVEIVRQTAIIQDVSIGTEDGQWKLEALRGGVLQTYIKAGATAPGGLRKIELNPGAQDIDFRVGSDSSAVFFEIDAGFDAAGLGGNAVSGSMLALYGDLDFQQASEISSTAGNVTFNPNTNTDASSDPILIQNVSQTTTPGTTTDGQIRLWQDSDAGGVDGRIVFQVNGTTFQINADAGLTFTNNPLILARDKALFGVGHAQWKLDRIDGLDDDFLAFTAAHPGLGVVRIDPVWSGTYLDHLRGQYANALEIYNIDLDAEGINSPYVPTLAELRAENPWPGPTYTIAGATSNETISPRTGTQFAVGDPLVLAVDWTKVDAGATLGVHTVPALLKDELLNLLQTDAAFLNDVKMLILGR